MSQIISAKDVLNQLKADLIGKDSHRGVTLTYSWMANQFGHFSLGFIPTILLFHFKVGSQRTAFASFYCALIIAFIWLVFEIYNFLGPLLLDKFIRLKALSDSQEQYIFQPAWGNITYDTITDIFYFWLGSFTAAEICQQAVVNEMMIASLLVCLVMPTKYWYLAKMYMQEVRYPYQFRLSQWQADAISAIDRNTILNFVNNKQEGQHLLVFGGHGTGRTTLSIGIATERSISLQSCVYTSAFKLNSMLSGPYSLWQTQQRSLWNLLNCNLLVIDDINPGNPVAEDLITPLQFHRAQESLLQETEERNRSRSKNVIWVLNDENLTSKKEHWKSMLLATGVEEKAIFSVHLH